MPNTLPALLAILFAAKLRRCLSRFRKRRELIHEWLDLEASNVSRVSALTRQTVNAHLSPAKAEKVLCGLEAIFVQSQATSLQLEAVLGEKHMQFGSRIVEICLSFEAYGVFVRSHVERQLILKQLPESCELGGERAALEETAQKIVFRTYQLSLLVTKYLKCLRQGGTDIPFFRNAIAILTNLNKKHDNLLKQELKLKEQERIERLIGRTIGSAFLYSEKCHCHSGKAILHVFESEVALEAHDGRVQCVQLDRYCSVFSKEFDGLHMGCLVAKTRTLHFIFGFSSQLQKFLKVVDNLIRADDSPLTSTQTAALFQPFLAAQVVDYREAHDLRGNKQKEFTIIFSALYDEFDSDQIRSSMRESGINWTQVDFAAQPQELNEVVTLNEDSLRHAREVCEKEYGLHWQQLHLQNFSGKASGTVLAMLQWETLLNGVLRSRTVINNPILLLKQLQVTDVFLESALSRNAVVSVEPSRSGLRFHCRLCACLDASSLQQFFRRRLRFLARKYGGEEREYCYYIFQKIREEVCKVSVYELNSCWEVMAWRQLRSGGIDYCFRKSVKGQKLYFVDVAVIGLEERSFEVELQPLTLASEIIDQVCLLAGVPALYGYRLTVCFEGQELLLRPNDLVFPLIDYYNIKFEKAYSSSLFSKFKSFGKILQFSENGFFLLKQVIFCPLGKEQAVQREWQQEYTAFQFKTDRLVCLSRDAKLELIILFGLRQLHAQGKPLLPALTYKFYEKYLPNSLEEQVQECIPQLQKFYELRKTASSQEVEELLESKLSLSPFYLNYVCEMRVCEMSERLQSSGKVKSVQLGVGWEGVALVTPNEKLIFGSTWQECAISLGTAGLKISREAESITLKGLQVYETFWLLREYKAVVTQWVALQE